MKKIDESIMYLFKSYLIDKPYKNNVPYLYALKKGILIDNKVNEKIIDLAIDLWGKDGYLLNQTFHKSLNKVITSSTEELVIKQIIHYITTYGFESLGIYNKETVYIPKEKLEVPEIKENIKLINITPITKEELKEKLWTLITSSIPLSKNTIEHIINLTDYLEINNDNINKISNREIKIALYDKLNIIPENNIEFLRYLIYKLTDKTLLIKDKETIETLKKSNKTTALQLLKSYKELYSLIPLSEIFNRFKPLFLSLKTSKNLEINYKNNVIITKVYKQKNEEIELNKLINKISKLSKTNHKPLIQNDLDKFIVWYKENYMKNNYVELLEEKLKKENIWRIIKLRNYIYLINTNEKVYKIRNGKTWVCNKHQNINITEETTNTLDNIIINKLKPKVSGKRIYLDKNIDLTIPQSEKQFVGNIPFSSSITINKTNILAGIHWYNINESRVDLDLKIISKDCSIGWDVDYKEEDKIIFTGDVTDAPYPNGASEYIYISKQLENKTFSLKVNNYTQNIDDVYYDIIIARKPKNKLTKNYIVDPSDILIKIPKNIIEKNKYEHSIGNIIIDNNTIKLVFTDLTTSNKRTSSNNNKEEILRKYLEQESNNKCKLKEYLKKAGAIITDDKENIDIDLGIDNLNKNSIIELFT